MLKGCYIVSIDAASGMAVIGGTDFWFYVQRQKCVGLNAPTLGQL